MKRIVLIVAGLLACSLVGAPAASAQERPTRFEPCVQGMAGEFPCHRVDMLHYFTMDEIGGGRGSDVWGWEDPATGRDYVIAGRETGTSFIDVTDAKRPVYLGNLPTASPQIRIWRDIKVYANHAYIVTESTGHGMQVFDLTQLREVDRDQAPVTFTETARYTDLLTAHNIAINEDTGFLYAVSVREGISCNRGLHMVDIRDPANPTFAGCFEESGAIHDTQCVVYEGPDARFRGHEVCFNSSPDSPGLTNAVSIVDVTDKSDPIMLARMPYGGSSFSHQGWLTEDQAHFLHGDEGDELDFGHPTRTLVWDVSNLTAPSVIGTYFASTPATDHNMYVKKRYLYQSNYRAGLRILDLRDVEQGRLQEVAFFDVYPPNDDAGFSFGTWSNYPFLDRGVVAVHGYQGLWLVKPRVGQRRP
jgi:choice-of-anchor B domain-containing protein